MDGSFAPFYKGCAFCILSSVSVPDQKTVWPSGLRRQLKALVRKGVGSNPTAVIFATWSTPNTDSPSRNMTGRVCRARADPRTK